MRVFAMKADWDGIWHSNQNVTPHSAIETFTVPTCLPPPPLACADGGLCAVGDIGPGGGVVFYVHDDADDLFTSTGSDCGSSCRYLEAAPSDSSAGMDVAAGDACYTADSDDGNKSCSGAYSVYSNSENQAASRTTAELFGQGMTNTNKIYSRATTVGGAATSTYLAGLAWAYSNNGKTDWFLPSKQELNELCKYARQQTTGDTSVACTNSGSVRSGFVFDYYYSSSEASHHNMWIVDMYSGNVGTHGKGPDGRARFVRAFG